MIQGDQPNAGSQAWQLAFAEWGRLPQIAEPAGVERDLLILGRRGYARHLMHDAEGRARAAGADVMRLDAFDATPRTCALYVGLGYRHAGHVRFRKGPFRCYEKRLV